MLESFLWRLYMQKCIGCGVWFTEKTKSQKYCNRKCFRKIYKQTHKNNSGEIKKISQIECLECGNIFIQNDVRQRVCSEECRNVRFKRHSDASHAKRKKELSKIKCIECMSFFMPCSYAIKTCSEKCIMDRRRRLQAEKRRFINTKPCPICKKMFYSKFKNRVACSDECRNERRRIMLEKNKKEQSIKNKIYRNNNIEIISERKRNYYKTTKGKLTAFRAAKKRRARKMNVSFEKIDYDFINKRDNYTCQICKKKVDFNLPHTSPMYKNYDHIYPISKGGDHKHYNIQLTHSICNRTKGNRISKGVQQFLFNSY